jgi:hypothetical protein
MLSGATPRAEEIAGTAVLRMVVSSDSIKNATATSHGRSRLEASEAEDKEGSDEDGGAINGPAGLICRKLREASPPGIC